MFDQNAEFQSPNDVDAEPLNPAAEYLDRTDSEEEEEPIADFVVEEQGREDEPETPSNRSIRRDERNNQKFPGNVYLLLN